MTDVKKHTKAAPTEKIVTIEAAKTEAVTAPDGEGQTLDELAAEVGAPTVVAQRAAFRGADEPKMLERGQGIASETILRDGAGFVRAVRANWALLSDEKRVLVLGYAPALDAVIVHELVVLRTLNDRYDLLAHAAGSSGAERRQRAKDAFTIAVNKRLQSFQTFRDYLGAEHPVVVGLAIAMRRADDAATLANGLTTLAGAIERARHGTDDAPVDTTLVEDLDFAGLTDALVHSLRACAKTAVDTDTTATARPKDLAAAQRALDLQDGRVLHAIGMVLRAFRRTRRTDPSMLVPGLGELAHLFGAGSGATPVDEAPPEAPAAPEVPVTPAPTPTHPLG